MASMTLPDEDIPPPSASAVASAPPVVSATKPKPRKTAAAAPVAPSASGSAGPVASVAAPGGSAAAASASAAASAAPVAGGDPEANALGDRVDAFYLARSAIIARFKQEFYIRSTGQKKTSSGTMKFQRPGKMSWKYDAPNNNVVVCDGTTVTFYEAENQQYHQQPFARSEYPGAMGFLTGDGIRKHFTFTFHKTATFPGGKVLIGTPKQANPGYQTVLFYIDDKTAHVRRVVIMDAQGNRNRFDFEALTEAPIDASEFVWTPPPGATKVRKD